MKKLATIFLGLALTVSLAACAPKNMPEEKVKGSYLLSDALDPEETLVLNVGEESTYELNMPVDECEVSAEASDPAIKVHIDEESNVLTVVTKEPVEGEINLTFEAKGYTTTSVPINVCALLKELEFDMELAEENDENISLEEDLVKVPVGETACINLNSKDGTKFAIKESVEGVQASIKDNILTITPETETPAKINIVADKDEEHSGSERTIDVVGVPTVDLQISIQQLTLLPGEKATVNYTTDVEGSVKTIVKRGDARAEVLDGSVVITGGNKASKIEVRAGAESYISGSKEISIAVKELPKEQPQKPTEEVEKQPDKEQANKPSGDDCEPTIVCPDRTQRPVSDESDSNGQTLTKTVDVSDYEDDIAAIIKYTNQMREEAGVPKLEHVEIVDTPATLRAEEASERWSHTRPDGTMYYTMFEECGLSYGTNGENLFMANTYLSPKKVVEEWMSSKGHRENILRKEFTGIGVGCYEINGEVYWCQLFVA